MRHFLVIFAVVAASGASAQSPLEPPTERVRGCTTGGCHQSTVAHNVLHGPTAVGACDVCHQYADPAKHTFTLKQQGRELCGFCHIDKVGTEGPVVHDPVAKGDCLGCHNPHGAPDRRMLRRESLAVTCAECHQETIKGSHVHEPAAQGLCTECHSPHTASVPGLLTAPVQKLCLDCHDSVVHQIETSFFPHAPVLTGCTDCHTTHASDVARQLKAIPRALCSSCHPQQELVASKASHPHSAVLDDRACLNCHLPHGGGREGLLPEDVAAACLICHKDPIKGPGDKVRVAGVPELAVKAYFPHGPVHDGDCAACHTLHGGELANLLTVPYAEPFYQKFSEEAYALCFSCHDAKLARTETTENGTGFRDGTRNLHFVHVAKEATGRSCRACHTVHASRTPAQIAESVQFGQWSIPLNFAQTATGGSCAPGCHRAVAYDREQAVGDSITAPPSATGAEPNPGPSGTPPPR